MAVIKRILLATDFSSCARLAEDYAWWLAAKLGARIDVLHVIEFMPGLDPQYAVNQLYLADLRNDAQREFARMERSAAEVGLQITTRHTLGVPSQEVTAAAVEYGSDLIILGTHGRTGLEHILLGSTAERVVRTAPCPVWCIRGPRRGGATSEPIREIRHILVPMDFSDCALAALDAAVELATSLNASVTLVHIVEPVGYGLDFTLSHASQGATLREPIERRLRELAATPSGGRAIDRLIRSGLPADAILATARTVQADLIVMGTHGRRGISHLVSGSVAEAVLRKSECPVLTVKYTPKEKVDGQGTRSAATETAHR